MMLFEVEINCNQWWVAAEDEEEALDLVKEDLYCREISDEELDEALEDADIRMVDEEEAETINVMNDYGYTSETLLDLFLGVEGAEVLTTNFVPLECEDYDDYSETDPDIF